LPQQEELFELTMMFFGLTSLLAAFQTIINKILRDLINAGKVVSFINDVIVETEEFVKRLVENDLYN